MEQEKIHCKHRFFGPAYRSSLLHPYAVKLLFTGLLLPLETTSQTWDASPRPPFWGLKQCFSILTTLKCMEFSSQNTWNAGWGILVVEVHIKLPKLRNLVRRQSFRCIKVDSCWCFDMVVQVPEQRQRSGFPLAFSAMFFRCCCLPHRQPWNFCLQPSN